MKLKDLIEIELGKDLEHEKIIKSREETLLKKIKTKQVEKRKTLTDYENRARHDTKKTIAELKKTGILKELQNFNKFVEKKIKEYIADTKEISITGSDTVVKVMTDLFLKRTSVEISKNKQKMIIDLIKAFKNEKYFDPETKEGIEVIKGMLLISEPELHQNFRDVIGKRFADLDIEDLEEFISTLSKDSEMKLRIVKNNKALIRFADLLATTKYLSQIGTGKTIRLLQRK